MSRATSESLQGLLSRYETPTQAAEPLARLLELLAQPNAPTAVHNPVRALDVHIADSLAGLEAPEIRTAGLIADLGAGAGPPGLVLAAVLPNSRIVLVEAASRKCAFLRSAIAAMDLANAEVVCSRAEEWREGIGRCDVVCARALAALSILCEYAAPLLRPRGILVAWKGAVSDSEAADACAAASHLGLEADPVRPVAPFPGSGQRTLHVLRKIGETPANYPRRPGIATKRPLSARSLH